MSKTRTFIAVAAGDEVYSQARTTIASLSTFTDNVRWVASDSLHWTLQFLGDIDDTDVYAVCREVTRAAAKRTAFSLESCGVHAFPSIDKPRTIWMGAGAGSDQLCELQDAIEERMADLGYRPERRRYTPHLTIGRVQRGSHAGAPLSEQLARLASRDGGLMEVDEVLVYGSELSREGPTYHVLGRAPLTGCG